MESHPNPKASLVTLLVDHECVCWPDSRVRHVQVAAAATANPDWLINYVPIASRGLPRKLTRKSVKARRRARRTYPGIHDCILQSNRVVAVSCISHLSPSLFIVLTVGASESRLHNSSIMPQKMRREAPRTENSFARCPVQKRRRSCQCRCATFER